QADDGIRAFHVTGVQTCALPISAKPDEHELTAEEWKGVLAKLKRWLGPFNLTFTGGEPFLRKDILDIFRFAADNGIMTTVVSNRWEERRVGKEGSDRSLP